jgi:hypothetical protein
MLQNITKLRREIKVFSSFCRYIPHRKQKKGNTVMGMAASQARFLSLTARKTNVEFEGQQINQQRTSLSNESANYYSQLCNMVVPTPPSSEDFSKTVYTFVDGSETNTINTLIAQRDGMYILNYTQSYETENVVSNGSVVTTRQLDTNGAYNYYIGSTKLREMATREVETMTEADITAYKNTDEYLATLENAEVRDILNMENQYLGMLSEKYGQDGWFVKYQKNSTNSAFEPVFYNSQQVIDADYSDKTGTSLSGIKSYVYGQTTETREIKNAKARVEQDTSGRYISVYVYETLADGTIKRDENGNEIGTEYQLTATTQSDDRAYNDAMNEYNYNKAKYDQDIQAINAKIVIIHGQDKDLELRLKQLDTEESAISTEMEAVKKVISKNVDSSFKTFNA